MIAGPLTLTASIALSPRVVSSAARQLELIAAAPARQYISAIAALIALALLLGAVLGLAALTREPRPVDVLIGAALSLVGIVATAASTSLGLFEWQMTRGSVQRPQMVALLERLYHSPGLASVFYFSGLLGIGLAVLALALARAGALWPAAAIALAAGALGIDVGFAVNSLPLALVASLWLVLGLGWAGVQELRR